MSDIDEMRDLLSPFDCFGRISPKAIREAESRLGIRFPPSYRTFVSEFGTVCGGGIDIAGLSDYVYNPDCMPYWLDVVEFTLQCRGGGLRTPESIPKDYIAISHDGGDYTFYLDTSKKDDMGESPVIVLGPGADGIVIANNFYDFLPRWIKDELDF